MDKGYRLDVLARIEGAEFEYVPYREVHFGKEAPVPGYCHQNVDAWVQLNPGNHAVRGWAGNDGNSHTAHSVVQDEEGHLFDITLKLGAFQFVRHTGCESDFMLLVENKNIHIYYPLDMIARIASSNLEAFQRFSDPT
ncbi:hypothetical protein [Roseococcus sp.]|uniref:hypothetical protein n=1 Tax=Roseococcus sp. TaxID=2109646 RepID=UPI003BAD33A3